MFRRSLAQGRKPRDQGSDQWNANIRIDRARLHPMDFCCVVFETRCLDPTSEPVPLDVGKLYHSAAIFDWFMAAMIVSAGKTAPSWRYSIAFSEA